jgi:two-component system chemotaxis response regulator CheY
MVSKKGYEVAGEAENGEEALAKFEQLKPDLVTMDIVMLGMDGIATVKKMLEIDPKANIVMVSAMGQQALIIEAIQAGAKGFIIKPFTEDAVLDEIKRILKD